MKIIITESQLNELKIHNQKYLDQLLDKISKGGMESLSDEEKNVILKLSRNEDPEIDDNTDFNFIIEFWKSLIPKAFKKEIDNETWLINKIDAPMLVLHIVNPEDGFRFRIIPLAEYRPIIRITVGDQNIDVNIEESDVPKTKKEIDDYNFAFMNRGLIDIIKMIDSEFRYQ